MVEHAQIREDPPSYEAATMQRFESFENSRSQDEETASENPQFGKALYDFSAGGDDELSLTAGEEVEIDYEVDGWYYVSEEKTPRQGWENGWFGPCSLCHFILMLEKSHSSPIHYDAVDGSAGFELEVPFLVYGSAFSYCLFSCHPCMDVPPHGCAHIPSDSVEVPIFFLIWHCGRQFLLGFLQSGSLSSIFDKRSEQVDHVCVKKREVR
ncbi:hypothetical protein ACLOJK_012492 [Asimina triloba]